MAKILTAFLVLLGVPFTILAQPEVPRWPRFRGIDGQGIAADNQLLPIQFSPRENVLWKIPVPTGHSSPCIWGDHLFLTGFDGKNLLETLCIDRRTGAIRWRRPAPTEKIEKVYKVNSPASSTPATDGQRVYVYFGSYGLLCYDLDGNELWKLPLPAPRTSFGTGTSPVLYDNRLLLNGQGKDLHLEALDPATGNRIWAADSPVFPSDYPTPTLWRHKNGAEIVVPGRGGILSYNLNDGSRRWWIPGLSPECNTTPVLAGGLLLVTSHMPGGDPDLRFQLPEWSELVKKFDKDQDGKLARAEIPTDLHIFSRGGKEGVGDLRLSMMFWLFDKNKDGQIDPQEYANVQKTPFTNSCLAIRPGGEGDIGHSHIAWQFKKGIPEVPSPLVYEGRVYLVRNGGFLTCLDAATGKAHYPPTRLSADGLYYASPVAGDGKIFVASDSGVVTVLKSGPSFDVLAENDLGEIIRATPALVEGKIYLRTLNHLYAFQDQKR